MKQKSKKLSILFIISLVMILCFATIVKAATLSLSKTALELEVGKTETLTCTGAEENATINWASSDTSIATIDSTGKVTAVKEGTATITATVGEDTATCAVTIKATSTSEEAENVQWTDFSKAEYEVVKNGVSGVNLNIKNVNKVKDSTIYYCITSTNDKPKMEFNDDGRLKNEQEMWDILDTDNLGVLKGRIEKYVQLNQDLYLWVYEEKHLENAYRDDYGKAIYYIGKILSSGQKLTRPKYPVYAEIFHATFMTNDTTQIVTTIPYEWCTERKFTLKIGKITDNNILNGIKNNNGDSWNSLLEYAKNSNAIFNNKLTTNKVHTSFAEYSNDKDEKKDVIQLNNLEDKAYYYMYVVFDDENGKYYPASGLTIAKANVNTTGVYKGYWSLFFLGDDKFKWDDFGTDQTGTATVDGKTTGTTAKKPSKLPKTGTIGIGFIVVIIAGFAVFFKVKNNKYKGI